MTTVTGLRVQRQAGALGAIIEGVDLSEPVNDATFAALHEAFLDHQMICIRGQSAMTPDDQLRFAERWGQISIHPYVPSIEGYPGLMRIYDPNLVTQTWHSDTTHAAKPPSITLLLAHHPAVRWRHHVVQRLPGLRGPFGRAAGYPRWPLGRPSGHRAGCLCGAPGGRGSYRPPGHSYAPRNRPASAVRERQLHGRVRRMECRGQRAAPQYLYAQVGRAEYVYRHKWQVGDLVMWDNRCTQHAVVADTGGAERALRRVTIEGDTPV